MDMPKLPRMTSNDDVMAEVIGVIADQYAAGVEKEIPPRKFARQLMFAMRDEHLFFVARIDGAPDHRRLRPGV